MPKGIRTDAEIELTIYGSQKGYPELLDLEVLFEPLEEQLYLPSILVEAGNLLGSQ